MPQRQTVPGAEHATIEARKFQAATAQISANPVGVRHSADHPAGTQTCFLIAVQLANRSAKHLFNLGPKFGAVSRFARGRRCYDIKIFYPHRAGQRRVAAQTCQRALHTLNIELAGAIEAAANAANYAFVENRNRCACPALINHQSDRVRSDIEHAGRLQY